MVQKIYIFFGFIAAGKTSLAAAFASARGYAHYNTDRVRKELAGIDPSSSCSESLNKGIYSKEFSQKTYESLLKKATIHLKNSEEGVVLDGSYHSRKERDRVRRLGALFKAKVIFILCRCSEEEVKKRLIDRSLDHQAVSDGNWNIYTSQKKFFQPPDELPSSELFVMNTEKDPEALLENLLKELNKRQL